MQPQAHRKAIVISALLTAFLLATAAGGLFLVNRFAAAPVEAADPAQPPVFVTVQPVDGAQLPNAGIQPAACDTTSCDALIAAYQTQLQESYQALQEAYGQIDQLQAAQAQVVLTDEHEHEDDHDHDKHGLSFDEHEDDDDD